MKLDAKQVTGNIAVANGGTGAADAATARTNLGAASTTSVDALTTSVNALRSLTTSATSGTLVIGDRGSRVPLTAGGITVPASVFATNDIVTLDNTTGASITIVQGVGLTLITAGTTTSGNFTLAANGLASVVFRTPTQAVIAGNAG
jgi:hypothetical protein